MSPCSMHRTNRGPTHENCVFFLYCTCTCAALVKRLTRLPLGSAGHSSLQIYSQEAVLSSLGRGDLTSTCSMPLAAMPSRRWGQHQQAPRHRGASTTRTSLARGARRSLSPQLGATATTPPSAAAASAGGGESDIVLPVGRGGGLGMVISNDAAIVDVQGLAAGAGIEAGWRITAVDGRDVSGSKDAVVVRTAALHACVRACLRPKLSCAQICAGSNSTGGRVRETAVSAAGGAPAAG